MKDVTLIVLTAPACAHCDEFLRFWGSIKEEWPNVVMREVSMLTDQGQDLIQEHRIFASPGIILNGELFSAGSFDKNAIQEKLKILSVI